MAIIQYISYYFIGGRARYPPFFGQGSGEIYLDDMRCNGTELSLTDCDRVGAWKQHNCYHREDAGVECYQNCRSSFISSQSNLLLYHHSSWFVYLIIGKISTNATRHFVAILVENYVLSYSSCNVLPSSHINWLLLLFNLFKELFNAMKRLSYHVVKPPLNQAFGRA